MNDEVCSSRSPEGPTWTVYLTELAFDLESSTGLQTSWRKTNQVETGREGHT